MTDLRERVNNLSPEQRAELLDRLKQKKAAEAAAANGAAARTDIRKQVPAAAPARRPAATWLRRHERDGDTLPPSFGQRRLWFVDQMDPGNAAYVIAVALRMRGQLDRAALSGAIDAMVRRHESLRTIFPAPDGEPVQRILPPTAVAMPVVEIAASDDPEAAVQAAIFAAAQQPFDLAAGPLFRATLYQLGADDHVIFLSMHHIVSDGWSIGVIIRELRELYASLAAGVPPTLEELPLQYADYALSQRDWMQGEVLARQLEYWKNRLADAPTLLELPTDRPRPVVQTFAGAMRGRLLPRPLADQLYALSKREGATLYMTLLAALQTLLSRYTGSRDILIGSPIAGRTEAALEDMIGFFLNTLVLRGQPDPRLRFRDLIKQAREAALGAYEHQDLPFERLIDELNLARDLSYNPLVQVLFVLQNMPKDDLTMPGLVVNRLFVENGTSSFDLALYAYELDDGIECRFEYSTDLFDAATIDRMLDHFQTLLTAAAADPDIRLADLPLLPPDEKRRILGEWAGAPAGDLQASAGGRIHDLIAAQAARTPEATALVFENDSLSYTELERRANRLARRLQALGVGPDVPVGLCLDRSLELVVAMLAILKAGGAYLPLDPTYPAERLAFMLEDTRAPLVLTQGHHAGQLPSTGAIILTMDEAMAAAAGEPDSPPEPAAGVAAARPENLAYLIYTSGSTGKPKGAMIPHAALVNHMRWMQEALPLAPTDRVLQKTPYSFDASVWEFFAPLISGACLVLAVPEGHRDPAYMVAAIQRHAISVLQLVPSALPLLLAESDLAACTSLRRLCCGGEALPRAMAEAMRERLPGLEIVNLYGPTEVTIDSVWTTVAPDGVGAVVPIGRPVANIQTYVLDRHMQPAPIGVPGELFLGGAGLARGYLGRPELTAEKFVPNPFGPAGSRLYRTGDRVRFLADGTIEYLGRIDHLVKVRGFRIELGEIEAAIKAHPAVAEAAVIVREDGQNPAGQRLVAYAVPAAGELPDLRGFLKDRLPQYMVPTAIVPLDALPLTPSGKLDRRALPEPGLIRAEADVVAPRTPLEERIAELWCEVLGLASVGIDDNFFDLGGDSFKAIRVVRPLDAGVSVLDLFKHPTIRGLAERLEGQAVGDSTARGILQELTRPIPASQRELTMVCVPFAGGSSVMYRPLAMALRPGISLYAVEFPGHDISRPDEPLMPLDEIASRAVEEIKATIKGPLLMYGHCMGGALTMAISRRLEAEGIEIAGIVIAAHFPVPRLPGKLWELFNKLFPLDRWTSKRSQLEFVRALGFESDVLDPKEQEFMMKAFLFDARSGEDYYTDVYRDGPIERLRAPLLCVIGDMDRVTELYQERYKEWEFFANEIDLAVIPQAGHYFHKHQAAELAQIIDNQWQIWRQRAPEPAAPASQPAPAPAKAQPAGRKTSMPRLRTFYAVALGQLVSLIGTGLTAFALSIWVYQQTGSVSAFAMISVFALLPAIVLAPIAGAVADRWDRRMVMLCSDSFAAIGTITLAALLWSGALEVWHVYLIVSMGAIANAFQQPAYMAAISQLVPKRYYGRANGLAQLGSAAGTILAPLIGGGLALAIGLHGIVLIDLTTFSFAMAITLLVRFPDTLFKRREEPFLREVTGGWRYIARRRGLIISIAFSIMLNYLFAIVEVLATPLILSLGSSATLGTILAASGLGLLVGGVAMSVWGGMARRQDGILMAYVMIGIAMIVVGLRPSPVFPALGLFGLGLATAFFNTHWLAIVQTKVGLELQGRVLATTQMLGWAMVPLGYLTAGPLSQQIFEPLMAADGALAGSLGNLIGVGPGRGIALIMIIAGLLAIGLGLVARNIRAVRFLEDQLPDAIPDGVISPDKDAIQAQADQRLATAN